MVQMSQFLGVVQACHSLLPPSEINAGKILLKTTFPFVDGLTDPAISSPMVIAISSPMVVPPTSEFVQIINVGSHGVWLSTIMRKPNAISNEHACCMLLHRANKVTLIYEKVQNQLGSSAYGPFALVFARLVLWSGPYKMEL